MTPERLAEIRAMDGPLRSIINELADEVERLHSYIDDGRPTQHLRFVSWDTRPHGRMTHPGRDA